jgi:hypothetical protein
MHLLVCLKGATLKKNKRRKKEDNSQNLITQNQNPRKFKCNPNRKFTFLAEYRIFAVQCGKAALSSCQGLK